MSASNVIAMTDPAERALMASINEKYSAAIKQALGAGSPLTESFLAALTANESGGDPMARRTEPQVHLELSQVLVGQRAAYGSIGGNDLRNWLRSAGSDAVLSMLNLATSWSLTQIMGYQALAGNYPLSDIAGADYAQHYTRAIGMLVAFARRWNLFPPPGTAAEFPAIALFTCWNTGSPTGKTADPQYAQKGLARMQIYGALP